MLLVYLLICKLVYKKTCLQFSQFMIEYSRDRMLSTKENKHLL